jgi:Mn2+/Fe2+ NRAMP family transporter
MYWLSKSIHYVNRLRRRSLVFLAVLGPGIIVMVADNDAGGISTYAVTGSRYGFSLLWIFVLLIPMAYFVQEMTVRLGAVTKRGHAEAIFDGFGPFWGWFSLGDLALINWLTLVTEYIGRTAAMSLLGVPPWLTVVGVTLILFAVVLSGEYWTFEKITLLFCLFNLVYVPAALWAMETPSAPGWGAVFEGSCRCSRGLHGRAGLHHARERRHHDRAVADLLPAERGGGQGARRPRHQVRQARHARGDDAHVPGCGVHHHPDRRRVLLPPPADNY